MHPELLEELRKIRERRDFRVEEWVDGKVAMLNEYMAKAGMKACIVNASGGVDSSVTIALCIEAMRKKNSPIKRVIGVAQPIHSTPGIQNKAYTLKDTFNELQMITVDQTQIFDTLASDVKKALYEDLESDSMFADGQLRSYMRTPVAYYVAQLLSSEGTPALVVGTGNKDEDGYLAYFCKAGDGICDIQVIADLHKSEVYAVGQHLNVPEKIISAPPSADLWDGQTDEDELGFPYDFVELLINLLEYNVSEKAKLLGKLSKDAQNQLIEWSAAAEKVHRRNQHKFNFPVNLNLI